jgi:uncharacterized membrane protein
MRWLRHLFAPSAASAYPEQSLQRIAEAIAASERRHRGQICFAVEAALSWRALWRRTTPRARAESVFARLRVWDTAANNGVLIYLLLAEHGIEIVADRGVQVDPAQWQAICARMAEGLRAGRHTEAALEAIDATAALLATQHARGPEDEPGANELPDRPRLL